MDDDDRRLQALFAHPPLADAGFSARVVRKLERRTRLKRLVLPLALLGGGVFALGPVLQLLERLTGALQGATADLVLLASALPSMSIALILLALAAVTAVLRWLEH